MEKIIRFLGNDNSDFEKNIDEKIKKDIDEGKIKASEIESIININLPMLKKDIHIDEKELKNLKTLCQIYNNDIRILNISSHRKFIGKFIVFGKKIVIKVISFAFKNYIKQQQVFNAITIRSLIDIYNKKER